MEDVNVKYYISKTYDYYEYTPIGGMRYKHINKNSKTGERITPWVNGEPKFKMNIYNVNRCLFVEDNTIAGWYGEYKNLIETTGYNKGVLGEDRENRTIYCKDNVGEYKYYKIEHEVDGNWADSEPMWAIINKEGFLWEPKQIYNYYFAELDECNKPTGRYFVSSMDVNPSSLTYTQIRTVETKITEGIIRTEKGGKYPDKYVDVNYNENETTLIGTE